MNRIRIIGAVTFVLAIVLGIGATVLRQPVKAAPEQESTTVTDGRRVRYPAFEVDVLIDGRPLDECYARGRTYIEALPGAEYEVRLRNPSGERVAVALSVDGLNTIDARHTSAWNASKWVIEPYQTITISGWQMSSERARRFYFTNERDSYGAKLGQTANLGVISAVFFRERRQVVIPMTRDNGAMSARVEKESAGTGIGRSVRHDVSWIDMDLDSRPVAEVTLRYEYSRRYEDSRRFCPEPNRR
jgi:hypothetical protein